MLDKRLERKLEYIKQHKNISERNKEIIRRYIIESQLGKTIIKGQKKTIQAGRNLQALSFLELMATNWLRKNFDTIEMSDMEDFILNLDKGIILSKINKPYASESKSNIKKFIRKFFKWLIGDNRHYPRLVEWIDTSKKEATIQAVPKLKDGVWEIVELIPEIRRKALVWVAFDSGFRLSELLNCRLRDLEKREDRIYYITCKVSKTKPRTVSLPYASELLDRWINKHPFKNDSMAQVFQISKPMFYKTVKLYGKKALGINVSVHMLRHTSATFYAPLLDRVSFCKRFGWSYNSSSPDRYIDFAKLEEKKVVEIVQSNQYAEMKQVVGNIKLENQELKDQMAELRNIVIMNGLRKLEK